VIERWLIAVRDHPNRPPLAQCHVLTMLALRLDWATGRGFASTRQLMADASAEERTVRRSTRWARDNELLLQTRRGRRLGNGQVAASEWQLTQPVTGDRLTSQPANGDFSTGQRGHLNRSAAQHHQESSPSESSPSPALDACELLAAAVPGASEREIAWVIDKINLSPEIRSPMAYLRAAINNGDAWALISEAHRELKQFADGSLKPENAAAPRPWCGTCNERTRLTGEDQPRRCPDCHPLANPAPLEATP
jgi:hypothetical protein